MDTGPLEIKRFASPLGECYTTLRLETGKFPSLSERNMTDWRKSLATNGERPPGRPLPRGVIDRFWGEAAGLRHLERVLRNLYASWGYTEYVPPTFEYAENLSTGAGAPLQEQMYRFFDRDGRMLALRPDMTIPTARLVGSKLFDQPFPQRFFYTGPVFRYNEPLAGMQREFYQAGVELIGVQGPEADGEILALAVESLHAMGLRDFRIVLGEMSFFRGLLQGLNLPPEGTRSLRSALDRKSEPELTALVQKWNLPQQAREAILQLPYLHGSQGILAAASRIVLNATMERALEHLQAIERIVDAYGVKSYITLDLAEVRGMEYYTGITFEGFAPGLGFALLSGGRYDNLVGEFGPPQPAVGFAITLDRALRAREAQGVEPPQWTPQIVVGGHITESTVKHVQDLRNRGKMVAWHYTANTPEDLWAYAQQGNIPLAVWCGPEVWIWHQGVKQHIPPNRDWTQEIEVLSDQ